LDAALNSDGPRKALITDGEMTPILHPDDFMKPKRKRLAKVLKKPIFYIQIYHSNRPVMHVIKANDAATELVCSILLLFDFYLFSFYSQHRAVTGKYTL
jgi:hypothetical protein